MSADDPRVDILAQRLVTLLWAIHGPDAERIAPGQARDLLARLDAVQPRVAGDSQRDPVGGRGGLAGWLDEQIADAAGHGMHAQSQGWPVAYEQAIARAATLREVRDRIGTTDDTTTPEGGTDD